jgi:hypothetical protein
MVQRFLLSKGAPETAVLVESAQPSIQLGLTYYVVAPYPRLRQQDWLEVRISAAPVEFKRTFGFWLTLLAHIGVAGFGGYQAIRILNDTASWGPRWLAWATVVLLPLLYAAWTFSEDRDVEDVGVLSIGGLGVGPLDAIEGIFVRDRIAGFGVGIGWLGFGVANFFTFQALSAATSLMAAIPIYGGALGICVLAWLRARRRERRGRNPLRPLLEVAQADVARTSIIC